LIVRYDATSILKTIKNFYGEKYYLNLSASTSTLRSLEFYSEGERQFFFLSAPLAGYFILFSVIGYKNKKDEMRANKTKMNVTEEKVIPEIVYIASLREAT